MGLRRGNEEARLTAAAADLPDPAKFDAPAHRRGTENTFRNFATKFSEENQGPASQEREQQRIKRGRIRHFQEQLLKHYGNMIVAWRKLFDPAGDGFVSYSEYVDALAEKNWIIVDDPKQLWDDLDDDDSKMLTLEEFHFTSGVLLNSFKLMCVQHGGVVATFQAMDLAKASSLTRAQFIDGCGELHWGGDPDSLYTGFDLEKRDFLLVDDILFLDNYLLRRTIEKTPDLLFATEQRELKAKLRAKEMYEAKVAFGSFQALLKRQFGSLIRGWKAIDTDQSFSLTKAEAFRACKRLGWTGEVRALWRALDPNDEGVARMEVLDPDGAEVAAQFLRWALNRGSLRDLYLRLDRKKTGKLSQPLFRSRLRRMGFKKSPPAMALLFKSLDTDGLGWLKLANLEYLLGWSPPDYLTVERDQQAMDDFKKKLMRVYGNYIKAWRLCLDTDSSNKVTWSEFQRACERLQFRGRARRARTWRALDDDGGGYITLDELDAAAAEQLISFRRWADSTFGSVRLAFKSLDRDKSGQISYSEWRSVVTRYGFVGDTKELFDAFDADKSGAITLDKIVFLETWDVDIPEIEVKPPKKQRKKKERYIPPPRLAEFRSQYEKEVCLQVTEVFQRAGALPPSASEPELARTVPSFLTRTASLPPLIGDDATNVSFCAPVALPGVVLTKRTTRRELRRLGRLARVHEPLPPLAGEEEPAKAVSSYPGALEDTDAALETLCDFSGLRAIVGA